MTGPPDDGASGSTDVADLVAILRDGHLVVDGRLRAASNVTLVGTVTKDGTSRRVVYKPVAGERPLWDFPDGTLAAREVAAALVSRAWFGVVPVTVLREEGPAGPGMCQVWVDTDESNGLVDVVPPASVPPGWLQVGVGQGARGELVALAHAADPVVRRVAVFDAVVNNADRKGGHLLAVAEPRARTRLSRFGAAAPVLAVDHGVCFHTEPKLRTVLWGWAGAALTDDERARLDGLLGSLDGDLGTQLAALLSPAECQALRVRVRRLLRDGRLPQPRGDWPALPWPAL